MYANKLLLDNHCGNSVKAPTQSLDKDQASFGGAAAQFRREATRRSTVTHRTRLMTANELSLLFLQ